jgi:hypothetical protein
MSKAEFSDVETIKNKITSSNIQYRLLGTNSTVNGKNNATFIGASNMPIEYVVKDETSSRRFFQITTLDKMLWKSINNLDYLQMWKTIDENTEELYIGDMHQELVEIQKSFKHTSVIEHFFKEMLPNLNNKEGTTKIRTSDLFPRFKEYRLSAGYTGISMGKHLFLERIRSLIGDPIYGRMEEGQSATWYYYNKD